MSLAVLRVQNNEFAVRRAAGVAGVTV